MHKTSKASVVLSPDFVETLRSEHEEEALKLVQANTQELFGGKSIKNHLTRDHLSLGIYTEKDGVKQELVAVLCLDCFPNIPVLPEWEWNHFLYNLYHVHSSPLETLWIHLALWHTHYTTLFLRPILQNLFQKYEVIKNIFMVCPPGIFKIDFIENFGTRIYPIGYNNIYQVQTLYHAKREDFTPNYVIRRAVEEDNDDLIAIIPKTLEDIYGEYYISELVINTEDTGRQLVVSEYRGCAVAVLSVNEVVNYNLLNQEFDLVPYHGLRKPSLDDELKTPDSMSLAELPAEDDVSDTLISAFKTPNILVEESVVEGDEDRGSDDDSYLNIAWPFIPNFLYDRPHAPSVDYVGSDSSIDSAFSAVVLGEEYEDYLYNASEKFASDVPERKKTETKLHLESTFVGEPNAFSLEICMGIEDHNGALYLLFQAAFNCFPDRDYCVTSIPTNAPISFIMKHYARVVPKANSCFPHELYVVHKSAILGNQSVRIGVSDDLPKLVELLRNFGKHSIIEDAFQEAVEIELNPRKAYVFLSESQIVGCAIVSEEEDLEYLELHYNLDEWVDTSQYRFGFQGCIEYFIVSPIFQRSVPFFMRELHRLSGFYILFYRLKRYDIAHNQKYFPIANCLTHLVPILPTTISEYSKSVKEYFQRPHILLKQHQPFALYLSAMCLTSLPRFEINHRIVIVGAGITTLAFLEALLFHNHQKSLIQYTNITVISTHGLVYDKRPNVVRDMVFVSNGQTDRQYLDNISFKSHVHFVTGVMATINRTEKYVGLADDTHVPYDYLILLCGEQFQKPADHNKDKDKKRPDMPQNLFIINTEADAGTAFNAMQNLTDEQKQGTMVVFGHYLEALCCLAALLKFGVSGSKLVYIDPPPEDGTGCDPHAHITQFFNNNQVEDAVFDELHRAGVTVYQDYKFVEWYTDKTPHTITSAKFEKPYHYVEIELSVFFMYYGKGVSMKTFQAIVRSGLVFNGHLIIDMDYKTNDPFIYGAGPLTIYSKRYYAEHLMHKYYSGHEIGFNLAAKIRKMLIPEKHRGPEPKLLKKRRSIVQHCKLPGNLHYLQVSKPGKPIPLEIAVNKNNYGKVLVTGDCNNLDTNGYFRLHINQYHEVETITCLTKNEIQVQNLISLWGKHEMLLNHLMLRFNAKLIPDLFSFFAEPWAYVIYQKNFHRIMESIDQLVKTVKTDLGKTLSEEIVKQLEKNDWDPLSSCQYEQISTICKENDIFKLVENKLLAFMHDNYMYLPMYADDLLIRWVMAQIQFSPLFVKALLKDTDIPTHALGYKLK